MSEMEDEDAIHAEREEDDWADGSAGQHDQEEGEGARPSARVLYDLLDLSPKDRWTYDEEQEEEDVRLRRLGPLKLAAAQLQWFWQELVPAALSELGLSSLYGAESVSAVVRWAPAALRQHRRGAPEWTLALSPAGDALAIVQNLQVSFRYAADNFRITKMTWKMPAPLQGPASQWRYCAWTEDSKYFAVGTVTGLVYVLQKGSVKHTFDVRQLGMGKALAGLAFRRGGPVDRARRGLELILITHERKVWRLPLPKLAIGIDPASPDIRALDVSTYHHSVGAIAYYSRSDLLAIAGGPHPLGDRSKDEGSLSLWHLSDNAPHFALAHSTMHATHADHMAGRGIFAPVTQYFSKSKTKAIYHKARCTAAGNSAVFSPSGDKIAVVDLTGRVDVHTTVGPSYTQLASWSSEELSLLITSLPPATSSRVVTHVVDLGWWSDELLLLAFATGEVIISPLHHLQNLLGLSGAAEIFEKQPSVTSIAGHKAFILECRQQSVAVAYSSTLEHRTNRRPADTPQELSTLRWLAQWLRNYAWEVAEHFWSPDWWLNSLSASMMRRLNLRKTYRLLALRQTTPLKLCLKLLQQERYEEALNLAQVYNLNTDLVYQKQWAAAPVSPESVKNYLNRIYDQRWVLWECHRRVPNEPQAVELLLEYGLQHTVPTWMYEYRASDSVDRTGTTASSSLSFGLTKPVAKRLSGGDKELCLHRLLFLQYLDRLRTFRQIIKDNEFCASTFLKFRSCELLAAAKEYARDENFDAVEVMLARHLELLVPHLLEILSQCPETTPPSSYERLLPPFLSLPDKQATPFRESDWVEEDDILAALGISSKNDLQQMYSLLHASSSSGASPRPPSASSSSVSSGSAVVADATRQDFRNNEDVYYDDKQYFAERVREETLPAAAGMELSLEQIERWYQDRAKEIDETSGQLENALILIECGLRRGVKGLEAVHNELVTLSSLVYDDDEALQHTHTTPAAARSDPKQLSHAIEARASSSNAFITFHRFHDLSDDAKLHLLLADSTDATLMRNMKTRALPFLQRLRKRNIDETSLLRQWMVSVAQGDRFHWCALIIQASRPTKDNPEENRIIQSPLELMRTALEVVYACPATSAHAIQQMGIIFESLPERVVGATEDDTELHSRADRLEKHLNTNEILLKYELAQPMSFFEQYEANPADLSTAHALLHRMAQKVVRGGGEANQVWIDLLRDMLIIRDQVFTNIGDEFCYRLFCSTLLHTGRFELAAEYLRQLGRATAEDLIVEAARLHFNSAASPHHREMAMAKRCLSMVPLSASLAAERDLIDGVKLLSKLGLHLLPVQIRLRLNAVDQLVAQLLETNPEVYKEVDELQQVGSLLGASVETKEKISLLIARAAFEQHDYETAHEVCQKLMSLGNTTVSAICADLARAQDYRDVRARLSLASFALSHCEVTAVGDLLALYRQLEARVQADATLAAAPLEVNKTESEATTANEDEAEQGIVSTMLSQELQVLSNATAAESRRLKAARFFPTHPFYSPQHHQEHKESVEETPHTEIGADEALLRLSLVAGGEGPDPSLVARLARANAHVDLPLTFAYLAAADQDDAAGELFEDMANRARDGDWGAMRAEEERWRLAGCYYFALRCLIYLLYAVPSLTLAGVDQSLFHDQDMASVVQRLQDLLDGRFLEEHKVNVAPIEETLSRFKSSYARLCTARQERQLAEVSGDVDKDRLTTDEVYGKEVLLGLGRTSKKAALTVAFTLARRYTFPEYLVAIESLEHTLRNPEASAQSFTDLATFLAPRLQNADADAVSVRLQQMACSGLRSGALLRLLRQLTSCSPALSSLFGSGPSSLALLYESALTHLLAAATQNAEAWQEELLPPPSFSLAEKDMAAITSQAHEAPDTPSSLLPWDPVPRSALLPSLLRLLASLCGEDENDSTTALAQHIESARRSVSGRLRAFLNPDAVSTEEQQVQLSLPDVRGRIIVGQALDYWAQHDAPHAWWHRPQAETSHENRDGDPAPTHDATTLARHRATAILLTTWPDLGQYDVRASLHSAEERVALFDRLLESSPSAEQIQNLAQLLLLWMEEGKSVWRASWARLLGELVRLEEDVMLISLRRGPTSRFLDQAEEEAIAAALSARQSTADPHQLLRVYCKFCLLSRYPSLADAAVERMVQESATDENVPWVDAELLATIVASPHLPRFTTTPYFPHLTRHLLREGAASTLALAASSLCIARQHLCAAALVGRALALATPLRTAHNALALLARFLRSHATTDATCAAALHQLSSDCPPPPAIAGQP